MMVFDLNMHNLIFRYHFQDIIKFAEVVLIARFELVNNLIIATKSYRNLLFKRWQFLVFSVSHLLIFTR